MRWEVQKNIDDQTIVVYNEIIFYGSLANQDLASKIAKEIQEAWNEPKANIYFEEAPYEVKFDIIGEYHPSLHATAIIQNPYPWRKFYKIVDSNDLNISFVDGLFSNTGEFLLKNIEKENSKTGPHEIGHNWGLRHPLDTDYRGKGQPHIMLPRGSFVDPQYRYIPEAELILENGRWVMERGFTVDTDKRKVLELNVEDLQLQNLNYNEENGAHLSGLSNKFH